MELLLSNEDLRCKIAASAPDWVRSRFDLAEVMPQLLRISEISLACDSRAKISRLLEAEGFVTRAEWCDLRRTLDDCIGRSPKLDLLISGVAHMPAIYRPYRVLRETLR